MNREILFRGKLIGDDRWSYGNLVIKHNSISIITPDSTPLGRYGQVMPETVGQYTGLTDKNGTRIFEGDILKCNDNPKDLVKVVFGEFDVIEVDSFRDIDTVIGWHYEVVPTDDLSKCEPFNISMPLTDFYIQSLCNMQIVGNIHDNPELLEQEG